MPYIFNKLIRKMSPKNNTRQETKSGASSKSTLNSPHSKLTGVLSKDGNTPNKSNSKGASKYFQRNKPKLPRKEWEQEDDFLNINLPKEDDKDGTARE